MILLLALLGAFHVGRGQTSGLLATKISLTAKNKTIPEILDQIERLGNFSFTYNSDIISHSKRSSLSVSNKSVQEVLIALLGWGYTFTQIGEKIVISPSAEAEVKQRAKQTIVVVQDTLKSTIYDTLRIQVNDTLRRVVHDTVRITDTIRQHDTINLLHTAQLQQQPYILNFRYEESVGGKALENEFPSAQLQSLQHVAATISQQFSFGIIGIGLGLKQSFSSVNYVVERTLVDSIVTDRHSVSYYKYREVTSYYLFKDGDTVRVPILDSTESIVTANAQARYLSKETSRVSGLNRYRFITVPLFYSVEVLNKKQHQLCLSLIVRPELLISAQGSIPTSTSNDFSLSIDFPRFSFSGIAELSYSYRVNRYSSVCVGWWGSFESCSAYYRPLTARSTQLWNGLSIGFKTIIGND